MSLFDVFAQSYFLKTNMHVATEEFFFCYVVLLLFNWSWSYNFGLDLGLDLTLTFWSCFYHCYTEVSYA